MQHSSPLRALLPIVLPVVLAAALCTLSGGQVVRWQGVSLLVWCAALAFGLQWLVLVPSFLAQTERFYDLTGSLTYLSILLLVATRGPALQPANVLVLLACAVWAARLGSFLFVRITRDGHDKRFTSIKPHFWRFATAWTLQGLWVFLTLLGVVLVAGSPQPHAWSAFSLVGGALWVLGFALEVVADAQKRRFRAQPANAGRFITTGLWAWSRHPNYAGEILLWWGVFVYLVPQLQGWGWLAVLSPLFVTLLLTRVSGIPLLERAADKRWGEDPAYRAYRQATPVLWPRPPR